MAFSNSIRFVVMVYYLQIMLIIDQPAVLASLADEWTKAYTEVFQQTGENLTNSQVETDIIAMHDTKDDALKHSSISEDMVNTVEYWFNAMKDTNQAHCNVDHMEDLRRSLKQISDPPTPNLVALYGLVFDNLKNVCSRPHSALVDALNHRLNDTTKIDLREIRKQYLLYKVGQSTEKKLAKRLFKMFGVYTTTSKDKIIKAWQKGACTKLKAQIEQFGDPSFEEFVKLVNYERVLTNDFYDFTAECWAKMQYACSKLDPMIADLAKNNNLVTITGRKISRGIDELGYSYAAAHSFGKPPPLPPYMTA